MIREDFVTQVRAFLTEYVYGFIFHDINAAIASQANYLAALGLVAYTEFMGGLRIGTLGQPNGSRRRFYAFFDTLGPEYEKIRYRREVTKIYSNIRCGLAHAYFINQESVVKMTADDARGARCGIEVDTQGVVHFIVERYWRDFQAAVERYRDALVEQRDAELLGNFRMAVGAQWHFTNLIPPAPASD